MVINSASLIIRPLLAIGFIVALGGCATNTQPKSDQKFNSTIRAKALPAEPIIVSVKDRKGREFSVRLDVNQWHSVGGRTEVTSGEPYLAMSMLDGAAKDQQIVRLKDVQQLRISYSENAKRPQISLSTTGQLYDNIKSTHLLLCPAAAVISPNSISECVMATGGSFDMRWDNGVNRKAPFADGANAARGLNLIELASECISHLPMDDFQGRLPVVECPSGTSSAFIVGTDSANLKQTHARREEAARIANAEKEKIRRAEIAAQDKIQQDRFNQVVMNSKIGTTLFCESTNLLVAGEQISRLSFGCDLTGRNRYVNVRELLDAGWQISSEVRSDERTMSGMPGKAVSLRFVKMK